MKNQDSLQETGLLVLGIVITVVMALLMGVRTVASREGRFKRG